MYQLDVLAVAHIQEMRREAEQAQAADRSQKTLAAPKRLAAGKIAAGTLIWAGTRLTNWGTQLQREYRKPAFN